MLPHSQILDLPEKSLSLTNIPAYFEIVSVMEKSFISLIPTVNVIEHFCQ
jgi:hypothetical protein